ncbi:hypothetical protein ACLMJK_000386 [Lecanora helva]
MSPRPPAGDWDLTPVIDLIRSLSVIDESATVFEQKANSLTTSPKGDLVPASIHNKSELGNFDNIWHFLDQPLDLLPPTVAPAPQSKSIDLVDVGAADEPSSLKVVRWRDELEGADLADNDENDDPRIVAALNKNQRKKARKKENRKKRNKRLTNGKAPPFSESEDDSAKEVPIAQTPDRKAVINQILHGNATPEIVTGRLRLGKVFRNETPTKNEDRPIALPQPAGKVRNESPAKNEDWPVASPQSAREVVRQILRPQKGSAFAVAAAKKAKLIAMLTETFIDERQFLSNISFIQHAGTKSDTPLEGIHVFVDISNVMFSKKPSYSLCTRLTSHQQIMIGFHDHLKLSRGQSRYSRIPRQPLSFHNFSLILERGRPAAKRIVVGSDTGPAITEAKAIGYETNILDRVHKAKELTPRQKKFMNHHHHGNGNNNGTGTGTGSGSETTATHATIAAVATVEEVRYAPEKWVEQAVDEILHLKMMESLVDASEPSTMVLATGDAAEAEYSAGFMKMVERALGKGWKVELACFRHNMSGAYNRREFRRTWGESFKIVELDDFVDVMLGNE